MFVIKKTATAVSLLLATAFPAVAEELGKQDFMRGCAGCHGESGLGQGPIAELLTIAVPDLTTMSENVSESFCR